MHAQRKEMADRYNKNAHTIEKTCKNCNTVKDGTHFRYTLNICKECQSVCESEKNNKPKPDALPVKCNKCLLIQSADNYRFRSKICRNCEKERLYEWREENKEQFLALCKKYRDKPESKEKANAYRRKAYLQEAVKIKKLYVNRIRSLLKKAGVSYDMEDKYGTLKYEATLGCDIPTLKKWIEFNFEEGMSWDNWGAYWHLDHVIPCAHFNLKDAEQQMICFHWSNLHPMVGVENLKKSAKIDVKLITHVKMRAQEYITNFKPNIQTDTLPVDLRIVSEVLDTKVDVKTLTGSGEKSEVG
jgi:hypothetical protein